MADITRIFWRAVTNADFFNIERSREAAPEGGGGQSYISVSFRGLTHEELGEFLGVEPPSRIAADRPTVRLDSVPAVNEPSLHAPLEFAARYRPPRRDDRYRIARQNRQFQARHPAWTRSSGFPEAPDDVASSDDPRMPDLTYLKVYVLRLDTGEFYAGFTNTSTRPAEFPSDTGLNILFEPFHRDPSAGVIRFGPGSLPLEDWLVGERAAAGVVEVEARPPEVVEALEATRVAAGKRPRGQGIRLSTEERRAIELHAVEVATETLEASAWNVEDVSAYRPYDLDCTQEEATLRVEVKGTTGDGESILLTPGEVAHAHAHAESVALIVVSQIQLAREEESGELIAEGGVVRRLEPWDIDAGELRPTGYEYKLPE